MSLLLKKEHKCKCEISGCKYKAKYPSFLKRHKAYIHNIGVTYHYCDVSGCKYKSKQKGTLKRHKANVHDIDVTYHHCDVSGCKYKFKQKGDLKRHKADIHNIGVTYHYCDVSGCQHKTKRKNDLKKHKADAHDIDVTWYPCDLCEYRSKENGHLKHHKAFVHDIGKHKCGFCYNNRNSKILYEDKHGNITNICRKCYKSTTKKNSRIEKTWSDYIDKQFGIELLSSSDKSLKSNGGCSLYRPDKLYIGPKIVIVGECDEHQHKWNNGSYTCDEKRISDIYEEQGIIGKKLIVIRWNPDNYKVPENYTKKNRKERLKIYIDLQKHLLENPPKEKIHIYYLFYDEDNPRLSQRIPHTLIYV